MNLLKANNDRMGYARRNGANIVSIRVHESENKAVYVTLFAIAMGVVFGWGLKTTLSAEMLSLLENNIASPLETMFMHAMLMMVPPVIFFSIINGLTHMSETADIGRIGKRMVVQSVILVMMVTVLSVLFGLLLFPTEMTYLAGIFERAKGTVSHDGFSLVQLIVDVVPPNLVDLFKGQNLMQILFLALFFGIVVNKLGEKARIA